MGAAEWLFLVLVGIVGIVGIFLVIGVFQAEAEVADRPEQLVELLEVAMVAARRQRLAEHVLAFRVDGSPARRRR